MLSEIDTTEFAPNYLQLILYNQLFFLIAQHLDVISLCCVLECCRATKLIHEDKKIWTDKIISHFPDYLEHSAQKVYYEPFKLFTDNYKRTVGVCGKKNRAIIALCIVHDFDEICKRKLQFTKDLLKTSIKGMELWEYINKHSHANFKHYVFRSLQENNPYEDFIDWAIKLDQGNYLKSFEKKLDKLKINETSSPLLYLCAKHNSLVAAAQLLDFNFSLEEVYYGATPLYIAASKGHLDMVHLLLSKKANIETIFSSYYDKGFTPLMIASKNGHHKTVQRLIEGGAKINAKDTEGFSALYYAMFRCHPLVVEILLNNQADWNEVFANGDTLIHVGVRSNKVEVIKTLLEYTACGHHKLNINAADKDGFTPLHLAAINGNAELCELLLSNGADLVARTKDKSTPLHLVASRNYREVAKVLLNVAVSQNKVIVNKRTAEGKTALFLAAETSGYQMCELLLSFRADVNSKNQQGLTPLHISALKGGLLTSRVLILKGASLLARDLEGKTPTQHAPTYELRDQFALWEEMERSLRTKLNPTKGNELMLKLSQFKANFCPFNYTWADSLFRRSSLLEVLITLLHRAPEHLGSLCFSLIVLSFGKTPKALQTQLLSTLDEPSVNLAQEKLNTYLVTILGGEYCLRTYLQRHVVEPILKELNKEDALTQNTLDEAIFFLNFFEMQFKRAEIEFVVQESCSSDTSEDESSILDLCENQFIGEEVDYEAEDSCDTLLGVWAF